MTLINKDESKHKIDINIYERKFYECQKSYETLVECISKIKILVDNLERPLNSIYKGRNST